MQYLCRALFLSIVLSNNGCATILGVTGANEGKIVDDKWIQYDVIHPGLSITIIELYTADLMPLSTVSKSSPSPLRHTIIFGNKLEPRTLEIIGQYQKDLYFDGQQYGSMWSGNIVTRDGVLSIDSEVISPD